MKKYLFFLVVIGICLASCQEAKNNRLKDGKWRAEFSIQNEKVPFQFEVVNATDSSANLYLINGAERFPVKGIYYSGDSVFIPIEAYDTQLVGVIEDGRLNGVFKKNFVDGDAGIPFVAELNKADRFEKVQDQTSISVSGRWDIQFISAKGDTTNNVGIFEYRGDELAGSILTQSGDLRYLDGVMTSDGFKLSAFGGLSPYLVTASFDDNNSFIGKFYTASGITSLVGKRNSVASLADPYSLTSMKEGETGLKFTFPNLDGENISLSDSRYKNKVVIISILGSWCPNCLDEMEFLVPWYETNQSRGVEIIGLAFERKDDPAYVNKVLSRLVKRYGPRYEILFAGVIGEGAVEKALPQLENFSAYPTTIFIDKQGKVRKIHTGFNGPATGLFYDEFKNDFNLLIDQLLAE